MTYDQAINAARQAVKDGDILAYATGRTKEMGRHLVVETEQGWNPNPWWQEYDTHQRAF